jgi:hypothetical protein
MAQAPLEEEIERQKWGWLGHTLWKPHIDINQTALELNPQGSTRRGRPNNTWRISILMKTETVGLNWNEVRGQKGTKFGGDVWWMTYAPNRNYRKH